MKNNTFLQQGKYYSSRDLSQLFRANESTIKRWADTGKLKCFKTPGGHRKFTREHVVEFITKYQYEITPFDFNFSHQLGKEMLNFLTKENYHTLSEVYFAQALRADKETLITILQSRYAGGSPLVEIYDEIVGAAARKILSLQVQGKLSEAETHVAGTSIFESLLQFKLFTRKRSLNGKVAVCGSLTNGLEEITLLGVNHLLEVAGWKVYNLGANTPLNALLKGIEKYDPALICASVEYLVDKTEGQSNYWKLLSAAELKHAGLLYFNFYTDSNRILGLTLTENSINILSSFQGLAPYIEKGVPIDSRYSERRNIIL